MAAPDSIPVLLARDRAHLHLLGVHAHGHRRPARPVGPGGRDRGRTSAYSSGPSLPLQPYRDSATAARLFRAGAADTGNAAWAGVSRLTEWLESSPIGGLQTTD